MTFTRRYLLWVLLPGAVVCIPIALLFLSQVLQVRGSVLTGIIAGVYGIYAAGSILFALQLAPLLREIDEESQRPSSRIGELVSLALRKTEILTVINWVGGGTVIAIVATFLVLPSILGFRYFIVAVMVAAVPSIGTAYIAAKRLLFTKTKNAIDLRFQGYRLNIGTKIALFFLIFFIVVVGALVEVVSTKVSTTLEKLTLQSANEPFERVYELANLSARVDQESLEAMKSYIPRGAMLHHIAKDGKISSAGFRVKDEDKNLTSDEIKQIRRKRDGDSSEFIAPHVTKFRALKDGSMLVLTMPWGEYRDIPSQIAFFSLIVALLTIVLFAIGTWYLSQDVALPIKGLMRVANEMANGNFDVEPRVFADDEVGALANTFNETRQNLRRLIGRMGGSGTTITEGVRVITGGTESLLGSARRQADLTRSSSEAVLNVRGGTEAVLGSVEGVAELTQDVSTRSIELQASAEEVAKSMDYLFQSVEKTSSSTTEMDASSWEMSTRTDTLANISEEVLSFVTEMDSTIDELRRNAVSTADISRQVREDAAAGGEAVFATVEGISVAKDSTEKTAVVLDELQQKIGAITQILRVIEEITDRTNLLSLNAAIIAAQAGEHGAGFTVVAEEIRQLAERTRGSTKEIAGIIKTVQTTSREASQSMKEGLKRVNQNVTLAQTAADSLQKIMGSASQSHEMANRIAGGLEQQSMASRHLHEVTSRLSDVIAEIHRGTQEQARGTKMMAEEAERVREIALQVKTATDEQSYAGRGITQAMEKIAADVMDIRDLLQQQLQESDRITEVANTLLQIAQENDAIAQDFTSTVQNLVRSGQDFESEVRRFKIGSA